MNPKTDLGRKFWDENQLTGGLPCLHSIRNWIEPEPAQVREQDGGIYILDAPLKVNSVPQEFDFDLPGDPCEPTKAQIEHNQKVVEKLIVPAVEKKIAEDAAYADLRRVYTSRVAAEWIRLQDAKKATDYQKIINSNDVTKWPIRGEKWDFNEIWQQPGATSCCCSVVTPGPSRRPAAVSSRRRTRTPRTRRPAVRVAAWPGGPDGDAPSSARDPLRAAAASSSVPPLCRAPAVLLLDGRVDGQLTVAISLIRRHAGRRTRAVRHHAGDLSGAPLRSRARRHPPRPPALAARSARCGRPR
jgi:hypothetical protein